MRQTTMTDIAAASFFITTPPKDEIREKCWYYFLAHNNIWLAGKLVPPPFSVLW
jgi:hypothetical protein